MRAAGACTPPHSDTSELQDWYYGNPAFANHQVIFVDWRQANDFCVWEGKRLP